MVTEKVIHHTYVYKYLGNKHFTFQNLVFIYVIFSNSYYNGQRFACMNIKYMQNVRKNKNENNHAVQKSCLSLIMNNCLFTQNKDINNNLHNY